MGEGRTGRWAQALGFTGVIVSLLFVAYELKQARDIALAEIYQQKTELIMGLNLANLEYPELLDARMKLRASPETLEPRDIELLFSGFAASMSYYENNHFLYQYGMVTEEQMKTIRVEIGSWLDSELYREWWMTTSKRGSWRASFAIEVDRILAGLGAVSDRSDSEEAVARDLCLASGKCQAGN